MAEDDLYEVEQIVRKKEHMGTTLYEVKWKGYPSNENTWEPIANLENVRSLLEEFELKQAKSTKGVKKTATHREPKRKGSFSKGDEVDKILDFVVEQDQPVMAVVKWKGKHLKNSKYPLEVLDERCPREMCQLYRRHLCIEYSGIN